MTTTMPAVICVVHLPARKSDRCGCRRTSQWVRDTGDLTDRDGTITIEATGCKPERYAVTRFPADMSGRAYRVRKCVVGGESYDVLIADRPAEDLCDCKGFCRFAYCKHVDALRAHIAAGHFYHEDFYGDADATGSEFEDIYADQ